MLVIWIWTSLLFSLKLSFLSFFLYDFNNLGFSHLFARMKIEISFLSTVTNDESLKFFYNLLNDFHEENSMKTCAICLFSLVETFTLPKNHRHSQFSENSHQKKKMRFFWVFLLSVIQYFNLFKHKICRRVKSLYKEKKFEWIYNFKPH
jgi:hypothetical protein